MGKRTGLYHMGIGDGIVDEFASDVLHSARPLESSHGGKRNRDEVQKSSPHYASELPTRVSLLCKPFTSMTMS